MRQKSTTIAQHAGGGDLRLHGRAAARLVHHQGPNTPDSALHRPARGAAAAAYRTEARRDPTSVPAGALPAPRATVPQPITGANPTTSCSTDVANRAERAACQSRNR
jgi:hypothetical protein